MALIETTRDTLNDVMEFDRVIEVTASGTVYTVDMELRKYWAPEVTIDSEADLNSINKPFVSGDGWTLLSGSSQQYGGSVMHPSEYVGGKLADHILSTPGLWVVVTVSDTASNLDPADDDLVGWAIAHKEA